MIKISSLAALCRFNQWFYNKIPAVLGIVYSQILITGGSPGTSMFFSLSIIVSLAGCAAYGYILNDSFDVEQDRLAGKKNLMQEVPVQIRYLLAFLALLFGFLPFLSGKLPVAAFIILAFDYLLATLYSAPPFRFKENAFLSVLLDGTAVHFLPVLLVFAIFSDLGTSFSICALSWSFFTGLRAIILHQLVDQENDVRAGVVTFVRKIGPEKAQSVIRFVLFPIELTSFLLVILLISESHPSLLVVVAFYIAIHSLKYKFWKVSFDPGPRLGQPPVFPFEFYESWFPPFLALLLVFQDVEFVFLLALHLILFYKGLKQRLFESLRLIRDILTIIAGRRKMYTKG